MDEIKIKLLSISPFETPIAAMNAIRIVVVDDHTILRETLVAALMREPHLNVVSHFPCAEDLFEFLVENECDVALLDNRLNGMRGISAAAKLRNEFPGVKPIILSMFSSEEEVIAAFDSGAFAYLPKDVSISELLSAIKKVHRGETVLSHKIAGKILRFKNELENSEDGSIASLLSYEQKTILSMIADGNSNKEISNQLDMSLGTVKLRVREIMQKLNAKDRTHAVIEALKKGILTIE